MKKSPTAAGNVFSLPLPDGSYAFGRVLLDPMEARKKRLLAVDSPLAGLLGQGVLVQLYTQASDTNDYVSSPVLVDGLFVERRNLRTEWDIVAYEDVDPRAVEFPEFVTGFCHDAGQLAFVCGEIRFPLPFPIAEQPTFQGRAVRHSAFMLPYIWLFAAGRREEVPEDYVVADLHGADLRISAYRDHIYEHLPFAKEMSYWEKQLSLALDFGRLYSAV